MKEPDKTSGGIIDAIANLFPGYFALVMATGIVSIAAHLFEMKTVAWCLLVINIIAFAILSLLYLLRFKQRCSSGLSVCFWGR